MAFRMIQWGTGPLGKMGIRHFSQNATYDLVGVAVYSDEKSGVDAGSIAEIEPVGLAATRDHEALLATEADCVFYTPKDADLDELCRILRSGKNVVSTTGYFYPAGKHEADFAKIEQACRDGGVSYHGSGIHPGFAGDLLALTLCRLNSRVDKVSVYEVVNFNHSGAPAARYLGPMTFGVAPAEFAERPNMLADSLQYFEQSMAMVAAGLGQRVDRVTSAVELGLAQADIDFHGFAVPQGCVAAQHHVWTAWSGSRPLIEYHAIYTVGYEHIEPVWNIGDMHYRIVVDGDPRSVIDLSGGTAADGIGGPYGYVWTAMAALHAIPQVCGASPGVLSHLELGVVRPQGLVRG